jgi:hypothetical protein
MKKTTPSTLNYNLAFCYPLPVTPLRLLCYCSVTALLLSVTLSDLLGFKAVKKYLKIIFLFTLADVLRGEALYLEVIGV